MPDMKSKQFTALTCGELSSAFYAKILETFSSTKMFIERWRITLYTSRAQNALQYHPLGGVPTAFACFCHALVCHALATFRN
ncbi:MAG TPA: hypothetical protein DEF45_13450 [Rhodopirellula sp.]|nr:hypothetical protein [Rhodopirellula sp.]